MDSVQKLKYNTLLLLPICVTYISLLGGFKYLVRLVNGLIEKRTVLFLYIMAKRNSQMRRITKNYFSHQFFFVHSRCYSLDLLQYEFYWNIIWGWWYIDFYFIENICGNIFKILKHPLIYLWEISETEKLEEDITFFIIFLYIMLPKPFNLMFYFQLTMLLLSFAMIDDWHNNSLYINCCVVMF